eukprot:GDKJ01048958.1.p1 GENE.GDKJ01048958.1~~GDKJ01048958.1.p1  ORF type:complete len:175 (-),score=55.47 GDKJ01048958.1:79-603(-)
MRILSSIALISCTLSISLRSKNGVLGGLFNFGGGGKSEATPAVSSAPPATNNNAEQEMKMAEDKAVYEEEIDRITQEKTAAVAELESTREQLSQLQAEIENLRKMNSQSEPAVQDTDPVEEAENGNGGVKTLSLEIKIPTTDEEAPAGLGGEVNVIMVAPVKVSDKSSEKQKKN